MPTLKKQLYITYGKYRIFIIDAQQFRSASLDTQEFGDYGIHAWWPHIIPENEIWLADTLSPREREFKLHNALYQTREIQAGVSQHTAYLKAEKIERKERQKLDNIKENKKSKELPPRSIYISKYLILSNNITVYLVDDALVEDLYKTDFIEGGNYAAYSFIPTGEIWIEKNLHPSEYPYIVIHEYVEAYLMTDKKYTYNKAHKIASKVEFKYRTSHPDQYHIFGSILQNLSPAWVEKEIKSH